MRGILPIATLALLLASPAAALTVRFVPDARTVAVTRPFTVEIRADLDEPVLGFGLDVAFDVSLIGPTQAPTIGPAWLPAFAPDGDGLAGVGPVAGAVGADVLLATLHLQAIGLGTTPLTAAFTAADPTEGFPLVGGGFAEAVFLPAEVEVQLVPEPNTGLLLALGVVLLGLRSPGSHEATDA